MEEMQDARFFLSHDFDMLERIALEKRKREHMAMAEEVVVVVVEEEEEEEEEDADFSFEFSSSVSLDLPTGHKMLSAEELFFNGKVRPLAEDSAVISENREDLHQPKKDFLLSVEKDEVQLAMAGSTDENLTMEGESFNDNFSLEESSLALARFTFNHGLAMEGTSFDESLAMAKKHLRSLHESPRCVSMTIEGSRGHPRRSCVSLNSSRCSSPSRTFGSPPSRTFGSPPSRIFSQPPTTPTSPKASSQKQSSSSKFMDFFKLRKHHNTSKETLLRPPAESFTSSCRLSRSFWPFSRSNSAGESKSSPAVSPPPRRSNSAGESKTSSSSLLPATIRSHGETKATTMASAGKPQIAQFSHQQASKKGLPPLPNPGIKKNTSCLVPTNCGYDAISLPSPSVSVYATLATSMPMFRASLSSSSSSHKLADAAIDSKAHMNGSDTIAATRGHDEDYQTHLYPASCTTSEGSRGSASSGRQVRCVPANKPGWNFAQGSPGRRGAWSSPNMGNAGRGAMRNLDRCNNNGGPPKGLVRPKDLLSRDNTTVRVTPVLNVPACITPSSKSKLFNLGNLFSKKEKAARGYSLLVPTESGA